MIFSAKKTGLCAFLIFLLFPPPSFSASGVWGFTDTIQMYYLDAMASSPAFSPPFTVFRATRRSPGPDASLADRNAGNFAGQLRYLEGYHRNGQHLKPGAYDYLQAFEVSINASYISDYFHCQEGACEFRLTCLDGPCKTPLPDIHSAYFRTGIKTGTANIQLSACNRSYVCASDVSLSGETGASKISRCSGEDQEDCFLAFARAGEGVSFRILRRFLPVKIDWSKGVQQIIEESIKESRTSDPEENSSVTGQLHQESQG